MKHEWGRWKVEGKEVGRRERDKRGVRRLGASREVVEVEREGEGMVKGGGSVKGGRSVKDGGSVKDGEKRERDGGCEERAGAGMRHGSGQPHS